MAHEINEAKELLRRSGIAVKMVRGGSRDQDDT
jgi:hypothetical protein